jgi:hypothetical protein
MRACQCDPQITGNQQHDGPGSSGQFGEKFRMSGKCNAGIVDYTLLQWQSDQRRKSILQTTIHCVSQAIEQCLDIGDRRLSARASLFERHGKHLQLAGVGTSQSYVVRTDFGDRYVDTDQLCARAQRFGVCNNDDLNRQRCP